MWGSLCGGGTKHKIEIPWCIPGMVGGRPFERSQLCDSRQCYGTHKHPLVNCPPDCIHVDLSLPPIIISCLSRHDCHRIARTMQPPTPPQIRYLLEHISDDTSDEIITTIGFPLALMYKERIWELTIGRSCLIWYIENLVVCMRSFTSLPSLWPRWKL